MIGATAIQGAVQVATMLAVPASHMIEANGDELMRLIGWRRRRGRGIIADWSVGMTFIMCVDERQCLASILRPLGGIMFQPTCTTCRLHHFIRKMTNNVNAIAGSCPGARPDLIRVKRVGHLDLA